MSKFFWILLFFIGVIILALPDNGKPLIRLNEVHGPSMMDLTGILLMMVSWTAATIMIINRWPTIIKRWGKRRVWTLTFFYFLALLGIVLGLIFSLDLLLWFFTSVAFMVNIVFVILALQVKNSRITPITADN